MSLLEKGRGRAKDTLGVVVVLFAHQATESSVSFAHFRQRLDMCKIEAEMEKWIHEWNIRSSTTLSSQFSPTGPKGEGKLSQSIQFGSKEETTSY